MRQRHPAIPAAAQRIRLRRNTPILRRTNRKAAQIVEAKLRRRKARKLRPRRPVQITQKPIAKPIVLEPAQLLLDALDRTTQRRTPRQRLLQIDRTRIKPNRKQAGEPTHRPRQVDIAENLLPTVTFQIKQNRRPLTATATPTPRRNRNHQAAQQHIVDAAMKRRRHLRQQRTRQRRRKRQRHMARRPGNVPTRIQ